MTYKKRVRQVSRGIYVIEGKVLLAKSKGKENYHLPGGGIGKFESAASALIREIKEELNQAALINSFIGIIENRWKEGKTYHYETNYLFIIDFKKSDNCKFVSNEENISFHFIDVTKLNDVKILPKFLYSVIEQSFNSRNTAIWNSNF